MAKAVKLADIAVQLGVSSVTVSKALSDQKGVSEEMRSKIKKLAQDMGYRSPSAARLLTAKKTYNIGVLISERYFDQSQSFYWQMYQEVATKAVSRECFTMLEVLSIQNEFDFKLPKLLQEANIDGLIIIGVLRSDYLSVIDRYIHVPYIYLDFYDKNHECDAVVTDNFFGMYRLVNHLFENGHKKIAYVGTLMCTNSITDRYMGYYKAMLEHEQEIPEDYIIDDRYEDTGDRDTDFQYKLPRDMPTAFACNCDVTAAHLIKFLQQKGYKVPEDISIVGFDNYVFQEANDVAITTYEVDVKEMARKTINILLKKVTGEHYKKGITIVDGHMVLKRSVNNINQKDDR